MARRATDNLRCYLREARLPLMECDPNAPPEPPTGHKSHLNHLSVGPEDWRRLSHIRVLADNKLESYIAKWIDTYVPEESMNTEDEDLVTGERISVACSPIFEIPVQYLKRPPDLMRLSAWLDNLPLMTVQRTMHLLFPKTRKWSFLASEGRGRDKKIFDYFIWANHEVPNGPTNSEQSSILVAYQPPWILSRKDMAEFVACRTFPPYLAQGSIYPTPLKSHERVWAKLWDTCAERRCHWFVLTSYNQWAFGLFTKGWTTAFITSVYESDDYGPTILEYLCYWIACAMKLPGHGQLPQVPEPASSLDPLSIPPTNVADYSTPAPSESNWDGKSVDARSSAGVYSIVSPTVSVAGLSEAGYSVPPLAKQSIKFCSVEEWVQNTEQDLMEIDMPASPTSTATSGPSTPQNANIPLANGEWMY